MILYSFHKNFKIRLNAKKFFKCLSLSAAIILCVWNLSCELYFFFPFYPHDLLVILLHIKSSPFLEIQFKIENFKKKIIISILVSKKKKKKFQNSIAKKKKNINFVLLFTRLIYFLMPDLINFKIYWLQGNFIAFICV